MLYLGWIFLWLVAGERIKGFNISDCSTKKFFWTYSARSEEEFVLFCDLPEPQKSHFYHRNQLSPSQGPEHLPCSGSKDLSEVQWYLQPQNGDTLREITKNYSHIILDQSTLRFLTMEMNNAGSYICRPRIRSPQDEACCVKMVLEVKPKTNISCVSSVPHKQYLLLGSIDSIYCPSLGCQSDAQSPEVTWYQNGRLLSEKRSNPMLLDEIYDYHQGTYVCDYTQSDHSSSWTVRAVVQVRTIVKDTKLKPDILEPIKDTLEVELVETLTTLSNKINLQEHISLLQETFAIICHRFNWNHHTSYQHLLQTDKLRMSLWVLAILTLLKLPTAATLSKSSWGLENEALIVRCPRQRSRYPVEWYHSQTNKSITTQKGNRIFASGEHLKLLPAKVDDSGIYTCIIRSQTFSKIGHVNVTIYKKQPDCNIPDDLIYSTTNGSHKNSKIYCPTINLYNWTAPVEWFKDCRALQGSRYYTQGTYLLIDNATSKDTGDYTCKFMHNENGVNYTVTATRSFIVQEEKSFSWFPVIIAPPQNETKDVEIGKTAKLTCSACFGKGFQLMAAVLWQVNTSKVANFSEARIREEQERIQSNELTCLSIVLRIADVREEDLLLKYDCLALNSYGLRKHTVRLRKKPIDHQSTYYILAGFGILLMLINVMMIMLKVFWIEVILLCRDIARPYKARNDGKIYDAYVIYPRNHKDSPEVTSSVEYFVHQILPDVLENKCGYKLCIYGRDLLPGEDAVTAVETNMRKSRRHIFILTPQILHSKEFAYEQEIALHRTLIQNESKAILIEMQALSQPGGLQFGELQDSLRHLVNVQGTIKWREDHVANKRSLNSKFWKHVRYHMPVPNKPPRKTSSLASLSAQGQPCSRGCANVPDAVDASSSSQDHTAGC